MVLGISLHAYTVVHALISFAAIASGIVVMRGLLTSRRMDGLTAFFLIMTALTDITGLGFPLFTAQGEPFHGVTPGIRLAVISLVALAIAIVARYPLHLEWRKTYVIATCASLYFNFFVLVVQSFEKTPALRAVAPTQKEAPFAIAQITLLLIFIGLTVLAAEIFHPEARAEAKLAQAA